MDLSTVELRVLGSLVEKQLTTPQQYPLTLNALVLACNQSSNRDPVSAYDDDTVEGAVTSVKTKGFVSFVHPSHGRSALRYRHTLEEAWGLDVRPLALLAVLVLRGAQTSGELRGRTERMVQFADVDEVEAELDALARRDAPLVERRPRAPGQKEDRYVHLLGAPGARDVEATVADRRPTDDRADAAPLPSPGVAVPPPSLADDVVDLRAEVAALRRDLDDLRAQLGA